MARFRGRQGGTRGAPPRPGVLTLILDWVAIGAAASALGAAVLAAGGAMRWISLPRLPAAAGIALQLAVTAGLIALAVQPRRRARWQAILAGRRAPPPPPLTRPSAPKESPVTRPAPRPPEAIPDPDDRPDDRPEPPVANLSPAEEARIREALAVFADLRHWAAHGRAWAEATGRDKARPTAPDASPAADGSEAPPDKPTKD